MQFLLASDFSLPALPSSECSTPFPPAPLDDTSYSPLDSTDATVTPTRPSELSAHGWPESSGTADKPESSSPKSSCLPEHREHAQFLAAIQGHWAAQVRGSKAADGCVDQQIQGVSSLAGKQCLSVGENGQNAASTIPSLTTLATSAGSGDVDRFLRQIHCPLCPLQLIGRGSLLRHVIKRHARHVATSDGFRHGNQALTQSTDAVRRVWHVCRQCKLRFRSPGRLCCHLKIHVPLSQYVCCRCGLVSRDRLSYGRHLRLHRRLSLPVKCAKCNRELRTLWSAFRHKQAHSRYDCHRCRLSCATLTEAARHYSAAHAKSPQFNPEQSLPCTPSTSSLILPPGNVKLETNVDNGYELAAIERDSSSLAVSEGSVSRDNATMRDAPNCDARTVDGCLDFAGNRLCAGPGHFPETIPCSRVVSSELSHGGFSSLNNLSTIPPIPTDALESSCLVAGADTKMLFPVTSESSDLLHGSLDTKISNNITHATGITPAPQSTASKIYACRLCTATGVYFRSTEALMRHWSSEHDSYNAFKCRQCAFSTKHRQNLHKHVKRKHPEPGSLNGRGSDGVVARKTRENENLATLTPVPPSPFDASRNLRCSVCATVFESIESLVAHVPICSPVVPAESQRRNGEPPGDLLSSPLEAPRNLRCSVCAVIFENVESLVAHVPICSLVVLPAEGQRSKGEPPGDCPICGRHFSRKRNMLRHYRLVHDGSAAYWCECGSRFKMLFQLKRHMELVHEGKFNFE